jgi:hypothetical protein
LGVDLDQRGIRIDVELECAVRFFLDVRGKFADEPVAKIALVDGSTRELVGDLQRYRRLGHDDGGAAQGQCRQARDRTQDETTAVRFHALSYAKGRQGYGVLGLCI